MGFRFRRSFRIAPGLRLNFSKSGISTSIGGRGATYNIGPKGTRKTVGLPGTGLFWTQSKSYGTTSSSPNQAALSQPSGQASKGCGWALVGSIATLVLIAIMRTPTTSSVPVASASTKFVEARIANCRLGADPSYAVATKLTGGTKVEVGAEDSGWSRVTTASGDCWISSSLLGDDEIAQERSLEPAASLLSVPSPNAAMPPTRKRSKAVISALSSDGVYYRNCSEARAAGAAPIRAGEPGYRGRLDRDGDGVACE